METTVKEKRGYQLKEDDKHYFAGFFNLAYDNIEDVINQLKQRMHTKTAINKLMIPEMALSEYEKYIHLLEEYFPMVRLLDNKKSGKNERIKNFIRKFDALTQSITILRNYFTHYHHSKVDIPKDTLDLIDELLLTTALYVKDNFLKEDKTKELLKDSLKEEIAKLYKLKMEELKEKKKNNPEKRISFEPTAVNNSLYNDAFMHIVYKDAESDSVKLRDFYSASVNESNKKHNENEELNISIHGIVFLLTLFLKRQEIEQLKANIVGYKAKVVKAETDAELKKNNSLKFMATQKVFSIWAYRGLRQRIRADETYAKETLMMQMVDELSKVPESIYTYLSDEQQKEFIEDWNQYFKENEEKMEQLEVVHPVIRKRYEDRFFEMALKYLDSFADFPTLRFQIFIGNYMRHTMSKNESIVLTNRVVKERINVYGKINDVIGVKDHYFEQTEDLENEHFEMYPNPCYNIMQESDMRQAAKIAIYVKLENTPANVAYRQSLAAKENIYKNDEQRKSRKNGKPTKKEIVAQIIERAKSNHPIIVAEPTAILSLNELPAMLYELIVNKKSGKEIEAIIVDKIKAQVESIKSAEDATSPVHKNIPKSIYNAGKEECINYPKLLKDITEEHKLLLAKKAELEIWTKEYNDRKNPRKAIITASEKGRIAMWIADDMKRYMPQTFKESWRGNNHSELQRLLAYYDTDKHFIESLLKGWSFQGAAIDLGKCFSKTNFIDFYTYYLSESIERTETAKNQLAANLGNNAVLKKIQKDLFKLYKKQLYTIPPKTKLIDRILAKPIHLPRGLFDPKPTVIPGKAINASDFAQWYVYANKSIEDFQQFYNIKQYPIDKEKLLADKTGQHKELIKIYKKINKQKLKDVYLCLMANHIFSTVFGQSVAFSLPELFQTRAERKENQKIANEQNKREKGDRGDNIINQNYLWNKEVAINLFDGNVKIDHVKLKDIGKFKKYEVDERIATLISYNPQEVWLPYLPSNWQDQYATIPTNILQRQIEDYETVRSQKLLYEIQQLEKYIYEHKDCKDKSQLMEKAKDGKTYPNFRCYIVNGLFKQIKNSALPILGSSELIIEKITPEILSQSSNEEKMAYLVIMIRNKFAHNQLPNQAIFAMLNTMIPMEKEELYATYYHRAMRELITKLK